MVIDKILEKMLNKECLILDGRSNRGLCITNELIVV